MAGAAADPARAAAALDDAGARARRPHPSWPRWRSTSRPARAWHRRPGCRGAAAAACPRGARAPRARPASPSSLGLCEVLVDQEAWGELEELGGRPRRRGDPRSATPCCSPWASGSSGSPTSRPAGPSRRPSCSRPRCPCCASTSPRLVGPVGWALGNALVSLGQWADGAHGVRHGIRRVRGARTGSWRLRTPSGGPATRRGRPATSRRRPATSTTPSTRPAPRAPWGSTSRRCGRGQRCGPTPATSPAGWPSSTPPIEAGERLAAQTGVGEDEFDGEVLEPHVLRQGAHLLVRQGEVDAAVERLAARRGPGRARPRARAARRGRHHARRRTTGSRWPSRGCAPRSTELHAAGLVADARRRRWCAGPGTGPGRSRRRGRGGLAAATARRLRAGRRA